jgi:peroxiredoxin Q/BCP
MARIVPSFLLIFAVVLVGRTPASAQDSEKPVELKVGDEAPEFVAVDDAGEEWKSIDHVGKKILVIYFYPKDMTPGCTAQACNYRDSHADLEKLGVEVIGVSGDTVESHQGFKKAHDLNFTLLADTKGELAKAFGVKMLSARPDAMVAARWTFVIDEEGHIAYKDDEVDAGKDTANVLKVVADLKKDA